MTSELFGESPMPEHKTLTQLTYDKPETFETYPTNPNDTCAILYTSGTTGQPKGAELTHLNLFSNVTTTFMIHLPVLNFTDGVQKTCLITLPLFHTTGQTVQMNTQIYGGSRIVLLPRFDAKLTLETMESEKVNFWVGVPTMYWALLKYAEETGYDVSRISDNMKICTSGGAPMPVEIMKAFEAKFGIRVMEGYGLSETSPLATANHLERPSKPGTVGQPILGVDVRCFDDNDEEVPRGTRGEIVIRGTNVMKGYYKRPEATEEAFKNGWFHTGDIGIQDEEGYFSIVDRKERYDPSRRLQRLSQTDRGSNNDAPGSLVVCSDRRTRTPVSAKRSRRSLCSSRTRSFRPKSLLHGAKRRSPRTNIHGWSNFVTACRSATRGKYSNERSRKSTVDRLVSKEADGETDFVVLF